MKTLRTLYFAACAAVVLGAAGCSKVASPVENTLPQAGQKVTISVALPESVATKVAMSELTDGSALALSWEAGDKLLVVSGDASQEFTIKDGFTDKYAEFEGVAPEGTEFDVILSRSGADYKSRSYHAQTQTANASTDHLLYDAWLEGVDSYTSVSFSQAWAEAHGGNFCQNGLVKFYLKMPAGVESVSELILSADGKVFYADNGSVKSDNVHVALTDGTLDGQVLTAYVMTSAKETVLASDAALTLTAVTNAGVYTKSFVPGKNIKPGKMNVVQLNDQNWVNAAMGTGTEADPYLLRTVSDLQGISGKEGYFKLMNDIDLTGVVWKPVCDGTKTVNFDGNGKTISNLTCESSDVNNFKASFFGQFKGSCSNVSFVDAKINGVKDICGIVAGQADGNFSNIYVSGTVTSAVRRTGGIIGWINNGSISNCQAKVSVSSSGVSVGGILGQAYTDNNQDATITISGCSLLEGSSVSGTNTYVGGIVGYLTNGSLSQCKVMKSEVSGAGTVGGVAGLNTANIIKGCVCNTVNVSCTNNTSSAGGIVGESSGEAKISECAVARGSITAYNMAGGIVGYCKTASLTIDNCYSHNCTITATNRRAGGIIGVAALPSTYSLLVSHCYSTARVISKYTVAGITGYDNEKSGNNTYLKCIAWNEKLEWKTASETYSSGAIVGYCARTHKLTDCIRKNDLNLIWPSGYDAVKPQDQENCDGTTTLLTKGTYADDNYGWKYLYPYHGKATDLETVSAVAKMLQWDETVWNLDGDLPTFR